MTDFVSSGRGYGILHDLHKPVTLRCKFHDERICMFSGVVERRRMRPKQLAADANRNGCSRVSAFVGQRWPVPVRLNNNLAMLFVNMLLPRRFRKVEIGGPPDNLVRSQTNLSVRHAFPDERAPKASQPPQRRNLPQGEQTTRRPA